MQKENNTKSAGNENKVKIGQRLSYDFKFTSIGNYDDTTVVIVATIPFSKLHVLYTLPATILKKYWDDVLNIVRETKKTPPTESDIEDYYSHRNLIKQYSEAVHLFDDFPHVRKIHFKPRKLSWIERITGVTKCQF